MTPSLSATIPATEIRTIQSSNVNQEYRITVALPYSYHSKPRQQYPTIYLIDANWYFGMVTEMTRIMSVFDKQLPETIVVGISYPVDEPIDDARKQIMALRCRDLTPTEDKNNEKAHAQFFDLDPDLIGSGGAGKFLEFIMTELIPMIEAEFRSNSADRILVGHSYGGLFVLHALFQQPDLFKAYVAGSPSLWYADKVMFRYESQYAEAHKTLTAKLYLSVGQLEEGAGWPMVGNMLQFATLLESRKYIGFSLIQQIIANCDHCASIPSAFQAGLQAVLT